VGGLVKDLPLLLFAMFRPFCQSKAAQFVENSREVAVDWVLNKGGVRLKIFPGGGLGWEGRKRKENHSKENPLSVYSLERVCQGSLEGGNGGGK